MAEPAFKVEEQRELAFIRRFEIADLTTHGPWLLNRFAQRLPGIPEQHIAGYLRGLVGNNEHLFLFQDDGVALAQLVHSPGIKTAKVVQERFVWVRTKEDKDQLEAAADFYDHIKAWAKRIGAERILVCEDTDVPKALIETRLGRLFDSKITHARV